MDINSIWDKRLKEYYSETIRYFSVITMSIVYSFIILGAFCLYYYIKFLQWIPESFPTELVATLVVVSFFLTTGRHHFLIPAGARLSVSV